MNNVELKLVTEYKYHAYTLDNENAHAILALLRNMVALEEDSIKMLEEKTLVPEGSVITFEKNGDKISILAGNILVFEYQKITDMFVPSGVIAFDDEEELYNYFKRA